LVGWDGGGWGRWWGKEKSKGESESEREEPGDGDGNGEGGGGLGGLDEEGGVEVDDMCRL